MVWIKYICVFLHLLNLCDYFYINYYLSITNHLHVLDILLDSQFIQIVSYFKIKVDYFEFNFIIYRCFTELFRDFHCMLFCNFFAANQYTFEFERMNMM